MSKPPRRFLGVTKQVGEVQESVTRIEPEKPISTGIQWRSIGIGFVPTYEEHTARLERGLSVQAWYSMDAMERAMIIAMRRLEMASRNIASEAEAKAAEQNAKRNRGKR